MPLGARPVIALLLALGGIAAACGTGPTRAAPPSSTSSTTVPAPTAASASSSGPTTAVATMPSARSADASSESPPGPAPVTAAPPFASAVDTVTAADLAATWRAGCPVEPAALRRLTMSHWGFDDAPHTGTMVVNESVVDAVVAVFRSLYDDRFPIRLMQPVDAYGGSDDASIGADNTAGFNCRAAVANGPPQWSQHAFGLAIDVNPLENPSVLNGVVYPPAGEPYLDRSVERPGMALPGGPLITAFTAIGWGWGGRWANVDYQHFSQNGR